jgi:hypothetical protein
VKIWGPADSQFIVKRKLRVPDGEELVVLTGNKYDERKGCWAIEAWHLEKHGWDKLFHINICYVLQRNVMQVLIPIMDNPNNERFKHLIVEMEPMFYSDEMTVFVTGLKLEGDMIEYEAILRR